MTEEVLRKKLPATLSQKQKAQVFDKFIVHMGSVASARGIISILMGNGDIEDVFGADFDSLWGLFREIDDEETLDIVMRMLLPGALASDLDAKKVTITW